MLELRDKIKELGIPVVNSISSFNSLSELITYTRGLEGVEGFIVAFDDGHRLKIKADQYVRIHKTLDVIRFDRNIVDLIVNEEIDDVAPMLPDHELGRIREFESRFWNSFQSNELRLKLLATVAMGMENRKTVAMKFIPTLENKFDAGFIFKIMDGHNVRDLIIDHVRKSINTNTKWEECAKWMKM